MNPHLRKVLELSFVITWALLGIEMLLWAMAGTGLGRGIPLTALGTFALIFLHFTSDWRVANPTRLRWEEVLDVLEDGLFETDPKTGKAYYSKGWKRMLGFADADVGDTLNECLDRVHPDDVGQLNAEIESYLRERKGYFRSEFRMRCKDGSYKWILSRGRIISDSRTGVERMVGVHSDISTRVLLAQEKDDALSFINAVLHSSSAGLLAFDSTGQTVVANEAAARFIGTSVEGVLKQNFYKLESWKETLLPLALRALALNAEVYHEGELITTFSKTVRASFHFIPFQYKGEKHLLLVTNDETERWKATEQLRMLQIAIKDSSLAMMLTDTEGSIQSINPAFTSITGYSEEEVMGKNPRMLSSGRESAQFYRKMWGTIKGGETWSGTLVNRHKDGGNYSAHATISPVRDSLGRVTHFILMAFDNTEREQLERQLSRSQRLESVGHIATGVVHDLNNMLAPIMLSTGLLYKHVARNPEALDHLKVMESAAARGASVLRQVLTFARGADGTKAILKPKAILAEIVSLAESTFPRNISVSSSLGEGVGNIEADPVQIHQVLLNLAVNARDAMLEGGTLRFYAVNTHICETEASRQMIAVNPGPFVRFGVADSGHGIPQSVIEHIFEPFYTTKARDKGTGLGLSTAYGIVRKLGGSFEVVTKEGQGTDFQVIIPLAVSRESSPPFATNTEKTPAPGHHILVVDDEALVVASLRRMLEHLGMNVTSAKNGREAYNYFTANPGRFSAVITDLFMPVMDGYKLVRQLRKLSPHLPVLVSTGLEDPEQSLNGLDVRIIHKPYPDTALTSILSEMLPRSLGDRLVPLVSNGRS